MFWFTFHPPSLVRNKALYHWIHDDVIKWKHFPRYWPFVRGVHRWPVNSPHKGQWRTALIYFVCVWINDWINNRETGDLRRHRAHYDVIVLFIVWENAIATSYNLKQWWPTSLTLVCVSYPQCVNEYQTVCQDVTHQGISYQGLNASNVSIYIYIFIYQFHDMLIVKATDTDHRNTVLNGHTFPK